MAEWRTRDDQKRRHNVHVKMRHNVHAKTSQRARKRRHNVHVKDVTTYTPHPGRGDDIEGTRCLDEKVRQRDEARAWPGRDARAAPLRFAVVG